MKLLIISGFLGAGKTTFIRELIKKAKGDFAIMENEYGAVGVDQDLLKQSDASLKVWELAEGCVCCTRKADFASSVLTIANTLDPEYLIVEPSGVGSLGRILENVKKIQYERISLLSPVTVVDGTNFYESMKKHRSLCADQIEMAGTVVVSKMESAKEQEKNELAENISSMNPNAEVCTGPYAENGSSWWQSLLQKPLSEENGGTVASSGREDEEMEALALTSICLENENELILFLQGVVSGVFGDISRAKGFLQAGEAWLRFDVVNHTYSVTGYEPSESSKGVFIGKGIRRSWLREVLQSGMYIGRNGPFPVSSGKKIRPERISV